MDSAAKRLYVSHGTNVVVHRHGNQHGGRHHRADPEDHGIAVASELGKGFISNGRENKAGHLRPEDHEEILSSVDTGANPDRHPVRARGTRRSTPSTARGKSATVFGAETGAVTATIPLGGKPEFAVVDVKAGLIFNNIEDKSTIVAIDTATHKVVSTWPIAPGEEASGLAIDLGQPPAVRRGCDKLMVMVDSQTGKVMGARCPSVTAPTPPRTTRGRGMCSRRAATAP